jgi:dTDP-4-dehydrorhamnose reductase
MTKTGRMVDRILVLGGAGMLGHKVYEVLSRDFDAWATFRSIGRPLQDIGLFDQTKVIDGVDACWLKTVQNAIQRVKPHVTINCVGMIKQKVDSSNKKAAIYLNALFPHLLAEVCRINGTRLIHISTDCVFSGKKGNYTEESVSDAEDLYGRTKFLGEIDYPEALTLRTSIIGHELFSSHSLVDWFLSNAGGDIRGYTKAIYSGFPTVVFARELVRVVRDFPDLVGLYQISSDPISKHDLLGIVNERYGCKTRIDPFDGFLCDRSLNSERYRKQTGFSSPSWEEMVTEMYEDYSTSNYYKKGRRETSK